METKLKELILKELLTTALSYQEIADKHNVKIGLVESCLSPENRVHQNDPFATVKRKELAFEYLLTTGLSYQEIADRCGFATRSLYTWLSPKERVKQNSLFKEKATIRVKDKELILEDLSKPNASYDELSKKYNVSIKALCNVLKADNRKKRNEDNGEGEKNFHRKRKAANKQSILRDLMETALSYEELAYKYNVSIEYVYYCLSAKERVKKNYLFSNSTHKELALKYLLTTDLSYIQIAEKCKLSPSSIHSYLSPTEREKQNPLFIAQVTIDRDLILKELIQTDVSYAELAEKYDIPIKSLYYILSASRREEERKSYIGLESSLELTEKVVKEIKKLGGVLKLYTPKKLAAMYKIDQTIVQKIIMSEIYDDIAVDGLSDLNFTPQELRAIYTLYVNNYLKEVEIAKIFKVSKDIIKRIVSL